MNYRLLLLIVVMGYSLEGLSFDVLDSLRTEKIKGKKYIIHRVDPKETLYAITRRYDVSVEDLNKHNPSLVNGLKMYDEIRVPIVKKKKGASKVKPIKSTRQFHIVSSGETLFALSRKYELSVDSLRTLNALNHANLNVGDTLWLSPAESISSGKAPEVLPNQSKYHVVKASETLFGISRMYQVEIEDLQQWNQLPDYTLSIGQKLLISDGSTANVDTSQTVVPPKQVKTDSSRQKTPTPPALDTLYVKTDNSPFKTKVKSVEGKKQTVEEGFAMKIEDTDYTSKYLALHRTAPLGSTIFVKNQMTNQVIEARVVGKLPESALNQKLLMRLSSAAYKALGARDLKTPVTVSYLEDE